jgi:hypothetical protein
LHESSNVGPGDGNPSLIEFFGYLLAAIDLPAFVKYGLNLPFEGLFSVFWLGSKAPSAPVIIGVSAHLEHLTHLLDWKYRPVTFYEVINF